MLRTLKMRNTFIRCTATHRGEVGMMILNWIWKKLPLPQNKSPPNNWLIIVPRKNHSKLCLVKPWMITNYKRPKQLPKLKLKESLAMKKKLKNWTVMTKKLLLKLKGNDSRVKLWSFWRRLIEKKPWGGKPKKQRKRGLSKKKRKQKLSSKNKKLPNKQRGKEITKSALPERKKNSSKQNKNE